MPSWKTPFGIVRRASRCFLPGSPFPGQFVFPELERFRIKLERLFARNSWRNGRQGSDAIVNTGAIRNVNALEEMP